MRLATFQSPSGEPRAGIVIDYEGEERIIDIGRASGEALPSDLMEIIAMGKPVLDAISELSADEAIPLHSVKLCAPLSRPGKLIAAAGNYQAHVVEGGRPRVDKLRTVPKLFLKPSTSIIGPGDALFLPDVSSAVDWELELAIVIGAGGRHIPADSALEHVFGYTVINDVSARKMDWGIENRAEGAWEGFFDWLEGKWVDGFAPMGPWIVTRDLIPDPDSLDLRLEVNGEVRQESTTAEMIFNTRELVAFASRLMTLEPGDVIATGTPAGVGDAEGTYLAPGDVMEGWIDGIGALRTPVTGDD